MKIQDKIALITGGTKGIGLGIAESMLAEGMKVAITGRSHEGIEKALAGFTDSQKNNIIGIVADVTSMEAMQAAVAQTLTKWQKIDVVIANAGVGHFASIEDLTADQWKQTIDVNLTGVFNTVKTSLDPIKKSEGYFITVASLAGTNFFAKGTAYNASKFGLVGFTQAMMLDLRQYGIKCSTIMPGSVSTYFNNHTPSESDAWKIQPEDIGQMTVDLLKMNPRTLPSKIEVRPTMPPGSKK